MNLLLFTLGSAALIIHHYSELYKEQDLEETLKENERDLGLGQIKLYDYIIVGGGTAGCLLASRLSEKFQVLLLEKGGNPPPMAGANVFLNNVVGSADISDKYVPLPQKYIGLANPEGMNQPVGRMLGGSGSHNSNLWNRGSPFDFDNWSNVTEDPSWSYYNMLQHFKRIENFKGLLINEGERGLYGENGPMGIETQTPPHLLSWLEAGSKLGFSSADPNAYQIESFTTAQASMRNGVKESSYTAYLKPAEGRKSLKILRYSEVDRLHFDDGRAYGVTYKRHGIPQIAHAKREILLSAGVFASPIILFKSGIGPKALLEEISVIQDLPGVGQNLQNHPRVQLNFKTENGFFPNLDDFRFQAEVKKFHFNPRIGNFSVFPQVQAFVVSSRARKGGEGGWPDLHFLASLSLVEPTNLLVIVKLGRPKSVGEMWFNTSQYRSGETQDTAKMGRPDFKYLSDPSDLDMMVEGIKLAVKILQNLNRNVSLSNTRPEACNHFVYNSDNFWRCFVTQTGTASHHSCGTCRMGRADDPLAVVDSKLRVRGVRRLRVVDASVMPVITNANTNAPVLAFAEKVVFEMLQN